MKLVLYLIIFTIFLTACERPDDGFVIDININGLEDGTAILQRRINSEFIDIDSSVIEHGKLQLNGKIDSPEMCYIYISDTLPYLRLFVENSHINITAHIDSLRNPVIKGSNTQEIIDEYNALMEPYEEQLQVNYRAYRKASMDNDPEKIAEYETRFDIIAEQQKATSLEFVNKYSSSVIGPYLIWGTLAYDLSVEELEDLSTNFNPDISHSIYVKQIDNYIETLKKVAIGQTFTDIALPDTSGEIQKLSDLKGKLILVDFWASWCGPCRRENPNVVALYNEYKDKNFEIFGVSFDESKEKWEKAIADDNLTWYHVSDLKGWNSTAGKLYGVRAIPHTVLISEEGEIIAKNLRGEELRQKVEELIQG